LGLKSILHLNIGTNFFQNYPYQEVVLISYEGKSVDENITSNNETLIGPNIENFEEISGKRQSLDAG